MGKIKIVKDIHIVRYFSSLITVSGGKVIKMTDPSVSGCRMSRFLYEGLKNNPALTKEQLKEEIAKVIEDKINRFGFCTKNRIVWQEKSSIPYGASEIISYGLKNRSIDCAVTVCDGVGTVVTNVPQVVQGIGARMHTVLKTSFIPEVALKLCRYGCRMLKEKGSINQTEGVAVAAQTGHKDIAVTVCASGEEGLKKIRDAEKERALSVTILAVCTTGIKNKRVAEIEEYADIVWECNSPDIKKRLSRKAIKKLSGASAVYILTKKGEKLIAGYSPSVFRIRGELL